VIRRRRRQSAQPAQSTGVMHFSHPFHTDEMDVEENHEPTLWLRGELATIGNDLVAGRSELCPHILTRNPFTASVRATTLLAALWRPLYVCCSDCAPDELTPPPDVVCSRCQAVEDMNSASVYAHGILVCYVLCSACLRREAATTNTQPREGHP
jgi:hypothetical protein